ncbi:MAG: hypothetical protein WB791_02840 [Waddliaceae bacterium]
MSSVSNNFSHREFGVDENRDRIGEVAKEENEENRLSRVANERLNPESGDHQEQPSPPLLERRVSAQAPEDKQENASRLWNLLSGGTGAVVQGVSLAYSLGATAVSSGWDMAWAGYDKSYELLAAAQSYFSSSRRRQKRNVENVYERAINSRESTRETESSLIREKSWDFITQQNITVLGEVAPERAEVDVRGETLQFAPQCIKDLSRGREGDTDVRVGRRERENLGGRVVEENRDYKRNFAWLVPTLAGIHDLTRGDKEMTFRITAFLNQRCMNKLINNMQSDIDNEFGIFPLTHQNMSWEVQNIPNHKTGEDNLVVIAHTSGTFPFAADHHDPHLMYPNVGTFRAGLVVNLTENTARADFHAELIKEKMEKKD